MKDPREASPEAHVEVLAEALDFNDWFHSSLALARTY
jgi:hypothetical protein